MVSDGLRGSITVQCYSGVWWVEVSITVQCYSGVWWVEGVNNCYSGVWWVEGVNNCYSGVWRVEQGGMEVGWGVSINVLHRCRCGVSNQEGTHSKLPKKFPLCLHNFGYMYMAAIIHVNRTPFFLKTKLCAFDLSVDINILFLCSCFTFLKESCCLPFPHRMLNSPHR